MCSALDRQRKKRQLEKTRCDLHVLESIALNVVWRQAFVHGTIRKEDYLNRKGISRVQIKRQLKVQRAQRKTAM